MNRKTLAITLATIGAITFGGLAVAQQHRAPQGQEAGSPDMGMMLIEGLRKTPGCLGVDAGEFMSGKNVIMAWFENKEAAKRWYYSPTHQQMMKMAFGFDAGEHDHTPMSHVADDVPILVIASITFADQPKLEGISMPISQIAIELYSPQPGGAYVAGRLAPATLKVEHMKGYTPPEGG